MLNCMDLSMKEGPLIYDLHHYNCHLGTTAPIRKMYLDLFFIHIIDTNMKFRYTKSLNTKGFLRSLLP